MNVWLTTDNFFCTLVSRIDHKELMKGKISKIKTSGYFSVYINKKQYKLHRYIASSNPSLEIDHIDNDPSNNTRDNLRECDRAQNCNNKWMAKTFRKSTFKGLSIDAKNNIYIAFSCKERGVITIPKIYFSEKFAYQDYCKIKIEQFGEFFYYKPIECFPLEIVKPRQAKLKNGSSRVYVGVQTRTNGKTWEAIAKIGGKYKRVGVFKSCIEAARSYDDEVFKRDGYLAFLNFPEDYTIFL